MKRLMLLVLTVPLFFNFKPLQAQETDSLDPPPKHALFVRGGTGSMIFAFWSYSFTSTFFGVAGFISDPHTEPRFDYTEYILGAGANSFVGNGGTALYATASKASDAWYFEPLTFLWYDEGRLSFSAFGGGYVPLEQAGTWQLFMDAARLLYNIKNEYGIGVDYAFFKFGSDPFEHRAGPTVQVPLPFGNASLSYLFNIANAENDFRVTLNLFF